MPEEIQRIALKRNWQEQKIQIFAYYKIWYMVRSTNMSETKLIEPFDNFWKKHSSTLQKCLKCLAYAKVRKISWQVENSSSKV